MNLKEYMAEARKTRVNLGSQLNDLLHMQLGLVDEVGELAKNVKKHFAYGADLDVANVKEELGDMFWFMIGICDLLNIDPDTLLYINIAKLRKRYPNKFNRADALARNIDAEREVLQASFETDLEFTDDYDYVQDDFNFDAAREVEGR